MPRSITDPDFISKGRGPMSLWYLRPSHGTKRRICHTSMTFPENVAFCAWHPCRIVVHFDSLVVESTANISFIVQFVHCLCWNVRPFNFRPVLLGGTFPSSMLLISQEERHNNIFSLGPESHGNLMTFRECHQNSLCHFRFRIWNSLAEA
jgi:hypothetical protein